MPYGLLGLAAGCALGHPVLGVALVAAALVNRVVQSVAIGYGVIGDRRALTLAWLYPLRDLLGFFIWCASYLGGPTFRWRGELYRFTRGGRIVSVERASQAQRE
jgi:ceramide glucosyltransferase